MTQLPSDLIEQLSNMAADMNDVWDERGHRVDSALALDGSFKRTNSPRSVLTNAMLTNAFAAAASKVGLPCDAGVGGVLELHANFNDQFAVFRLRRAERRSDGLLVKQNKGSTWGGIDENALILEVPFIFGFVFDADGALRFFAAEVVEVIDGAPGRLVLGPETALSTHPAPSSTGFVPEDDDTLPGFDEEDGGVERSA